MSSRLGKRFETFNLFGFVIRFDAGWFLKDPLELFALKVELEPEERSAA